MRAVNAFLSFSARRTETSDRMRQHVGRGRRIVSAWRADRSPVILNAQASSVCYLSRRARGTCTTAACDLRRARAAPLDRRECETRRCTTTQDWAGEMGWAGMVYLACSLGSAHLGYCATLLDGVLLMLQGRKLRNAAVHYTHDRGGRGTDRTAIGQPSWVDRRASTGFLLFNLFGHDCIWPSPCAWSYGEKDSECHAVRV